jgi:hypothetical protein
MRRLGITGCMVAILVGLGAGASGQGPYYSGKTIDIVIPTIAGTGPDIFARAIEPYLQKHIRGNPLVRIRNMPGGGGILGVNWYEANARPDGLVLLMSSPGSMYAQLVQHPAVRYDFRKYRLVAAAGGGVVVYVAPGLNIRRPVDFVKATGLVGGSTPLPGFTMLPLLAFEVLGANVRIVFGFDGTAAHRLAFERGELTVDYQSTITYKSQVIHLVQAGRAVPVFTMGYVDPQGRFLRDPALEELPTVRELYEAAYGSKPDGLLKWKAFTGALIAQQFSRSLWVKGEVPADALAELRQAVVRMSRDPGFLVSVGPVLEGYPLVVGNEELERRIFRSLAPTLDVVRFIREMLRTKYGQTL